MKNLFFKSKKQREAKNAALAEMEQEKKIAKSNLRARLIKICDSCKTKEQLNISMLFAQFYEEKYNDRELVRYVIVRYQLLEQSATKYHQWPRINKDSSNPPVIHNPSPHHIRIPMLRGNKLSFILKEGHVNQSIDIRNEEFCWRLHLKGYIEYMNNSTTKYKFFELICSSIEVQDRHNMPLKLNTDTYNTAMEYFNNRLKQIKDEHTQYS